MFYHSFKTKSYNSDIVKGSIEQNRVTVALGSTHGLDHNAEVNITVNPRNTGITTIQYDKPNRKVITRGLGFTASGITTTTSLTGTPDSIEITNHGLTTGQKVSINLQLLLVDWFMRKNISFMLLIGTKSSYV